MNESRAHRVDVPSVGVVIAGPLVFPRVVRTVAVGEAVASLCPLDHALPIAVANHEQDTHVLAHRIPHARATQIAAQVQQARV